MRKLQILLPLGGAGSRFSEAGFKLPKPLIQVDGIPMFLKSLSSLDPIAAEKRYIFVIRQEHVHQQQLDRLIKKALPSAEVVVISKATRGAVETCLAAKTKLTSDDGLIVMDCDMWFRSKDYEAMVSTSLSGKSNVDGGILTFPSNEPKFSYAVVNQNQEVTQTAEKQVISDRAITGAYFFAKADKFIKAAEIMLARPLGEKMPEYYTSLLYNILINEGDKIKAASVDEFASFGTPEELAEYQTRTSNA